MGNRPSYPPQWEADVVLADGGTARLRPIMPDDAERLVAFHDSLSPETVYLRFFAPYPHLSERDVERFVGVDHVRDVALLVLVGDEIVGVGRYGRARVDDLEAEVAFVVRDDYQGRGVGSVLLEHLAACARERGVRRFVAEVLPDNRRMVGVFRDAGYETQRSFEDGVLRLTFAIEPTRESLAVMRAREQRAESRSIGRLLAPRSVAVIGASRDHAALGHTLLRNLLDGEFQGPVYPVNPSASAVAGVPAYPDVAAIPGAVDLAVVAVPADETLDVVRQCARRGVHALVVVSADFGEAGVDGMQRQHDLVTLARAGGMRVVGPNCLGIANTDPAVQLNATLAPVTPGRGRVGFFSQSGSLGIAILEAVAQRGLGLSTFVSAGNRADVSGNDLLQYWQDDDATEVVLLYLESFGNPRKFSRLARRLARRKPVVLVRRSMRSAPPGHAVAPLALPDAALDTLLREAGVIVVDDLAQLFDVAQLLAYQPMPQGERVAIVGNDHALGLLARDACLRFGLQPGEPVDLGPLAAGDDFDAALRGALADPRVDAVVTVFVPPRATHRDVVAERLARAAADAAADAAAAAKPVLAAFLGYRGLPEQLRRRDPDGAPARGSVPSYATPEDAVRALASVARYARWRTAAGVPRPAAANATSLPAFDAAQLIVDRAIAAAAATADAGALRVTLGDGETRALLAACGIDLLPSVVAPDADQAVAAARSFGYPVAIKAVADRIRRQPSLGGVRLDVPDEATVRAACAALAAHLAPGEPVGVVVQPMAPVGVAVVVTASSDPSFGPVVSFGLGGVATELLDDVGYRMAPLSVREAAELVRSVRAAPLLFGHRGADPVDVGALERLLVAVGRLVDEVPQVVHLELNPVTVSGVGVHALRAGCLLAAVPPGRPDEGPRRLARWESSG